MSRSMTLTTSKSTRRLQQNSKLKPKNARSLVGILHDKRLTAGADAPNEAESAPEPAEADYADEEAGEEGEEHAEKPAETHAGVEAPPPKPPEHHPAPPMDKDEVARTIGGPCCMCATRIGSTGNQNVDESIDFMKRNLGEADKALLSLEENFEHDLKLVFVDILGKIRQWTGITRNKLDTCKSDVEKLRSELIARMCEIEAKARELAECRELVEDLMKQLAELKAKVMECDALRAAYEKLLQETSTQKRYVETPTAIGVQAPTVQETAKEETKQEDQIVVEQEQTVDTGVQSVTCDRGAIKREAELEATIARLRKENERILKERADYENAIQRALLRGVSSLNVEALRVLRRPPIPCCVPCDPCHPHDTCPENSVNNRTQNTCVKDDDSSFKAKSCNKNSNNDASNRNFERQNCTTPCCRSGGKNRKSVDSGTVLVLHRNDAGNICKENTVKRACGSASFTKTFEIPTACPRYDEHSTYP